ncbi:MAG: hypothetical protein G01um10147_517 [Microgenomates group bacterium Gr01-1014_7]|nr:MAG: hypothetical protein G01um10147_517 [Microgenomates group bacterium Gr01-1014_7]
MDLTLILSLGILLGCLLALSWFAGSDAPYVATKLSRIRKILTLAGLKKGQVFYELGSGDGRVVIEAAKMGAKAFGIEQSLIRVLYSKWKVRKLPNAKFIHGNIFKNKYYKDHNYYNYYNSDAIFIFLLPKGVDKLEPLLKKNLKRGAKVITQTFHFKNWKPYKKIFLKQKNMPNTLLGKNQYEGDFWIYRV